MKIITWNIIGINGPHKTIIFKKIEKEKPTLMLVQETKCFESHLIRVGRKSCRNCEGIGIDAAGEVGGLGILWDPSRVTLSIFIAIRSSLSTEFQVVGTNIKGILTNVYGPHAP